MSDDNDDAAGRSETARSSSKRLLDAFKKHVARPPKRSPLFWWLVEHHEELREVEVTGGLGIPWRRLCVDIAATGITAAGGKPVTWETARKTWQRVRKEVVRVEQRRAREQAEREARRAADPRRNMPSRFGKDAPFGPALSDVQPKPATAQAGVRGLPQVTGRSSRPELQLSTALGVVVTEISRVSKISETGDDFEFNANGIIIGKNVGWSSALQARQELNKVSGRPINDDTDKMYRKCGLELERL